MNTQPVTNEKWPEIKTEIKKMWSKISDQELDGTKGDQKQLSTLVNNKYSEDKEKNSKQIERIFSSHQSTKQADPEKSKTEYKQ